VNQRGALDIRDDRPGRDISFDRIIDAVESAERSRAPIERRADRLSGYLVYFALGAAVLTSLITRNIVATISVTSLPARAASLREPASGTRCNWPRGPRRRDRQGGRYLEALAAVDTVIFDKTGTVTYGTPEVRSVIPATGVTPDILLSTAAIAERRSEHPLGTASLASTRS